MTHDKRKPVLTWLCTKHAFQAGDSWLTVTAAPGSAILLRLRGREALAEFADLLENTARWTGDSLSYRSPCGTYRLYRRGGQIELAASATLLPVDIETALDLVDWLRLITGCSASTPRVSAAHDDGAVRLDASGGRSILLSLKSAWRLANVIHDEVAAAATMETRLFTGMGRDRLTAIALLKTSRDGYRLRATGRADQPLSRTSLARLGMAIDNCLHVARARRGKESSKTGPREVRAC